MRFVCFVGLFGLIVSAQVQSSERGERLKGVDRDDAEARKLYAIAVGGPELTDAESLRRAQTIKDEGVCSLIDQHSELGWLGEYAFRRSEVLAKDGITPESVRALKAKLADQLADVFMVRLAKNKPIKIPCGLGHCHGGICGDGTYFVAKSYQLADQLRSLAVEDNIFVDLDVVDLYWVDSVKRDISHLRLACDAELRRYRTDGDWPDSYDGYYPECQIVIRALHRSIPASKFKLNKATTERFMKLDPEK